MKTHVLNQVDFGKAIFFYPDVVTLTLSETSEGKTTTDAAMEIDHAVSARREKHACPVMGNRKKE